MKMKRIFSMALAVMLMVGTLGLTTFAKTDETADVYVSIADETGKLVLAQEKIRVTDSDGDGSLTINDALYAAHEEKYEGGAKAGYESYVHEEYGLSLNMLWGVKNGGSYGYYVNNQSAWNLADPVKEGDYINAFIYTDLKKYTDTYCYFDENVATVYQNTEISLALMAKGYDENWNPIAVPVKAADITINGEKTSVKTDENGQAVITIDKEGIYVISAASDTQTLVPPVCVVTVNPNVNVYVTIANDKSNLVLAQEEVTVSDVDKDGALTINDALYAAHEEKYEGGAKAGYESYVHEEYGLSLNMLWGVKNGGSYGYYVNNQSAWNLADPVKEGDYINAFIYTDLKYYSDTYCYFDVNTASAKAGEEVVLTLMAKGYDENWNPIAVPVKNATIIVDGEKTAMKTDDNGQVSIVIEKEGTYTVSAVSDTQTLVPPVCKVTVAADAAPEQTTPSNPEAEKSPQTGDYSSVAIYTALLSISFAGIIISAKGKKAYEK